jgi:hypothetical protein
MNFPQKKVHIMPAAKNAMPVVTNLTIFQTITQYNRLAHDTNTRASKERNFVEASYMKDINALKQEIAEVESYYDVDEEKVLKLQKQIGGLVALMEEADKTICLSQSLHFKNLISPAHNWKAFAPWKQATRDENVGYHSFQLMNLSGRLMTVLLSFSRGNSINYVEDQLVFFFPEAILKPETISSLVVGVNNPRPNKIHKGCSRFLRLFKEQQKYNQKYGFNFDSTRAMIVEFLEHVVNGNKFETGDSEFDHIGNNAVKNSQEMAKTLLDRVTFDIVTHLQETFTYREKKFITSNAKGCVSRPCEMSDLQKTIIAAFLCNPNYHQLKKAA